MAIITNYNLITVICLVAAFADAFVVTHTRSINNQFFILHSSEKSDTSTTTTNTIYDQITINDKITISDPT